MDKNSKYKKGETLNRLKTTSIYALGNLHLLKLKVGIWKIIYNSNLQKRKIYPTFLMYKIYKIQSLVHNL